MYHDRDACSHRRFRHGAVRRSRNRGTRHHPDLGQGPCPWAVFVGILALVLLYFVGAEQGATALISGEGVHEWVHDGRHLLGFPCH